MDRKSKIPALGYDFDWRKAKKNGTGSKRAMLLGYPRIRDERDLDIEETEHRSLDGERLRDERTKIPRGARMEAFGRKQIRESEERPLKHEKKINVLISVIRKRIITKFRLKPLKKVYHIKPLFPVLFISI